MVGGQPKPPEGVVMIKEITKSEFKERFPEVSIYDIWNVSAYLENGVVLRSPGWNGKEYIADGKSYKSVFKWDKELGQGRIIGYEERISYDY